MEVSFSHVKMGMAELSTVSVQHYNSIVKDRGCFCPLSAVLNAMLWALADYHVAFEIQPPYLENTGNLAMLQDSGNAS